MMFWSEVLTSRTYDGRLLRQIAVEAARFGRGTWIDKMSMCWGSLGARMLMWGYLRSCQMWK